MTDREFVKEIIKSELLRVAEIVDTVDDGEEYREKAYNNDLLEKATDYLIKYLTHYNDVVRATTIKGLVTAAVKYAESNELYYKDDLFEIACLYKAKNVGSNLENIVDGFVRFADQFNK